MASIRTASGRRIHVDESGAGPAVLVIPGLGGYRRGCLVWLADALAGRFRVVAMDNRDSGASEPETADYGLRDLAGDAAALLDALSIERAHVVAHSMGSAIALRLALDHADRINRLVLLSPCVDVEPEHRAGEPMPPPAAWWVDDPVERSRRSLPIVLGPDALARLGEAGLDAVSALERENRTTWAGIMRREAAAADDGEVLCRLPEIASPALLIHGDADASVPLAQAEALAAALPGARLVVLPGVGHRPWVENPEATIEAILTFLAETGEHAA